MLDDPIPFIRARTDALPPDAPLPMPLQVIERRRAMGWLRRLIRAAR